MSQNLRQKKDFLINTINFYTRVNRAAGMTQTQCPLGGLHKAFQMYWKHLDASQHKHM